MNIFEMDCPCKGRYLDKMLQPSILTALYQEDLHGFTLIRRLGEGPMFDGAEPDKAGVYRYLKKMEQAGLLRSGWQLDGEGERPRKIYSITDKGRDCLANWSLALKQYAGSIGALVEEMDGSMGGKPGRRKAEK